MNYNTKLALATVFFGIFYILVTFTGFFGNKEIVKYPDVTIGDKAFHRGQQIKFEEDTSFSIGNHNFKTEKNTEIILLDTRPDNIKINLLVGRISSDAGSEIQIRSHIASFTGEFEVIHQSWVEMATITTNSDWQLNNVQKQPGVYKLHTGNGTLIQEESLPQALE